jgi:hypothetical protein
MLRGSDRPQRWHCRNQVWCCRDCNNRKGAIHPLEWLPLVPVEGARKSLAYRLVSLGLPRSAVYAALPRFDGFLEAP